MRRRTPRRTNGPSFELSPEQILLWADRHHRRTGAWPRMISGPVVGGPDELTWRRIDSALRVGLRGLPGGSSLAQLLAEHRHVRNLRDLPPLDVSSLLAWADAHHRRTGAWPTSASGPVHGQPDETWRRLDTALRVGLRGLKGGSSLARVLADQRGVRNLQQLPRLTIRRILAWADAHHRRTGRWPIPSSGPVADAPGESWSGVHTALLLGRRSLPGGSSLATLLAEHRQVRHPRRLPRLTVPKVLRWARAYHRRTGHWPTRSSGPIPESPGDTWSAVMAALATGYRGLPGPTTLAALLAADGANSASSGNGIPSRGSRLTAKRILAWADAHHERTDAWPHARSGPIADASGETWRGIDRALRTGQRGLPGGQTLVHFLTQHRPWRVRAYPPPLTEPQILTWADRYRRQHGSWPSYRSGPVEGSAGDTWRSLDTALRQGSRGLKGDSSLARLLADQRGARNRTSLPRLKVAQVLDWARRHHQRTGSWPTAATGPVPDAPGETWKGIEMALVWGCRGLPGGTTLARLLAQKLGVRNRTTLPVLTGRQVLAWARAHRRRTGSWPTRHSGDVVDAPGETWQKIDLALRGGYRGLPGGQSLARLVRQHA